MTTTVERVARVQESIRNNELELEIIDRFLAVPFQRGENYRAVKQIATETSRAAPITQKIYIWVFVSLGGIALLYTLFWEQGKSARFLIELLVVYILGMVLVNYIRETFFLFRYCRKRKVELENLISINRRKLTTLH